ncbi:MAG: glycosyltransferase family 2 protein [Ferruginibacter sp.]
MKTISIIIPVYNEEKNIQLLYNELSLYCDQGSEIIFVDDGSNDSTFAIIESISTKDNRCKCISLSRNFGHQNALMAGMEHASGEYIIIMDGDLQHPPKLITNMLEKLEEGVDLVITKRNKTENIGALKKLTAAIFYRFINSISETSIESNVADFKAFNRKVLESILKFKERDLFLRGIFSWIGFKTITLEFTAPPRRFGKTKYTFGNMLLLALKGTTSFSYKPLRVALIAGSIISFAAFSFGIYAVIQYYNNNTVPGWSSLIIAVMFLGGTQLLAIGLLGEYIAGLFTEAKQRPLYLIDRKINIE